MIQVESNLNPKSSNVLKPSSPDELYVNNKQNPENVRLKEARSAAPMATEGGLVQTSEK
jgi:hypothetical protein